MVGGLVSGAHWMRWRGGKSATYSSVGALLVGGLAGDLEGNVVGGVALELEGGGREVVEVLVQELWEANVS